VLEEEEEMKGGRWTRSRKRRITWMGVKMPSKRVSVAFTCLNPPTFTITERRLTVNFWNLHELKQMHKLHTHI
jgi:hypothetical protein